MFGKVSMVVMKWVSSGVGYQYLSIPVFICESIFNFPLNNRLSVQIVLSVLLVTVLLRLTLYSEKEECEIYENDSRT